MNVPPPTRHFASDNYAGICPEAWAALAEANRDHAPGYGEDLWTQKATDLIRAESCLQDAFACDVRPAIREWRAAKGLPLDPMDAFRQSGYLESITKERSGRPAPDASAYA